MHYILDGYNIIHKTPAFAVLLNHSLQKARSGLIAVCKSVLQSRGDVAKITIAFDGKSDVCGGESGSGNLEILYSETGQDADDMIIDYLRRNQLSRVMIVSDDNYVCNNARAFKVQSMSVAAFFENGVYRSEKQKRRGGLPGDLSGKNLSPSKIRDITKEYAQYLGISE